MSTNEELAGELSSDLLAIYKAKLVAMKADLENVNVSLLREVREFLKQHHIELDAQSATMQDLKRDEDELSSYRNRRGGTAQ